ncbi:hypothetical protein [Pedobacter sp. SL55]|uniref:hypothetical protein n=1 Tax=Pedobacter sp. SL55 TaxID=2995161 RepID=UPI00226EC0F8|nr:hypothetical protein [Pedobacter sp. SL55]WAC42554.1 hypothetical protein OVA16_09430 [Pedobacter sp. SL55]
MKPKINIKKPVLMAGVTILAISLCIILPLEYSKANFISDLSYTFLGLTLAILTIMYGLMGKHFFKGLLFLFLASFVVWCVGNCYFHIQM